jgi:hypothetical protein
MRNRSILSFAVAATLGTGVFAQTTPDVDTAARLRELEAKVQALEAAAAANQNAPRRDDAAVDATRSAVALDATTRPKTELGTSYDPTKGLEFKYGDAFSLRPNVYMQFRGVVNHADGVQDDGDSGWEHGFEFRRARFGVSGNVLTKDFKYKFVWDANRSGGGVTLLDAEMQWQFAPEWAVKFGQFKDPVIHEGLVSSSAQIAVDRSLMNALIGAGDLDRVQGVAVIYGGAKDDQPLRVEVGLTDGANSKNTNFTNGNLNFGTYVRADYKLSGKWSEHNTLNTFDKEQTLAIVGGGITLTDAVDATDYRYTIDFQYENDSGFGGYAAVVAQTIDGRDDGSLDNYGGLIQGYYKLNPSQDVFARYNYTSVEDDAGDDEGYSEITVGTNYYLGENGRFGNRAKVSFDIGYLPDGSPSNESGQGIVASDDGQFVARVQFQLQI